jgi:hypothetical protein
MTCIFYLAHGNFNGNSYFYVHYVSAHRLNLMDISLMGKCFYAENLLPMEWKRGYWLQNLTCINVKQMHPTHHFESCWNENKDSLEVDWSSIESTGGDYTFLILCCTPFCHQNSLNSSGHGLYKASKAFHSDAGQCWLQCFPQFSWLDVLWVVDHSW